MLARFQRSLASVPYRYSRQLSTTLRRSVQEPDDAVSAPVESDEDDILNWEKPSSAPTPEPSSEPSEPSSSSFAELIEAKPTNGLSYAGLPEHKIFLDLPPAQDPLIHYLASSLLRDGRRHTAERRTSRVLLYLHTLTRGEPLPMLRAAIEKVMPSVRVARHRQSTKTTEIPVALNEKQQVRRAVKWILQASDWRGGRTIEERLAREIVMVLNGNSDALKQKDKLHNLAMVNRGNIPAGRASL